MPTSELTIIIPAYNAAKTLKRAVMSILNQTLKGISIIVVDDGSEDDTLSIAQYLASQHPNVRVVSQVNSGCYMARLAGLYVCDTRYFGFLDADDFVLPDKYEKMLCLAKEYDLDIVECDIRGHVRNNGRNELFLSRQEVLEKIIRPYLIEGERSAFVWDKIYRNKYNFREFLKSNYMTFEDMVFNIQFFRDVRRIGYLHEGLHVYDVTAASSTRNFGHKNIMGLVNAIAAREKIIPEYGSHVMREALDKWILKNTHNALITAACAPTPSYKDRLEVVKALLDEPSISAAIQRASRWNFMRWLLGGVAIDHTGLSVCLIRIAKWLQKFARV